MLPYLRAGLVNGDQCLCLIDRTDPSVIRDRLSAHASAVDDSQLDIRSAVDVYLTNGDFVVEEMIGFLDETAVGVAAMEDGRRFDSVTGEMSWATGDSRTFQQFFTYESELNRMTSAHAPALLCLFDLDLILTRSLHSIMCSGHTRRLFMRTASSAIRTTGNRTTILSVVDIPAPTRVTSRRTDELPHPTCYSDCD